MRMFRILQVVIGLVLIAMVWLNQNLASDQKLAFTAFIVLLIADKFMMLKKPAQSPPPSSIPPAA